VVSERSNHHFVESQVRFEVTDEERFSRLDFAMRVLDILNPQVHVTLYSALRHLQIQRGRDFARGPDASWALVAIPPKASRYHIAFALAELAGKANHPYVVDLVGAASAVS
jgi:hypothetical protein